MTTIINFLFVSGCTHEDSLTHSRGGRLHLRWWNIGEGVRWAWFKRQNFLSLLLFGRIYTECWKSLFVKWTWICYLETIFGVKTWPPIEQSMSTESLFIQTDYNFGWRRCYVYPRFIRPGTDGSQNCRFVYTYLELKFPKRFLLCNIRVRGTDVRWNCCDLFQILTARKIVVYLGGILTLIDLEPTWN